jgi:hypothetical protein
MGRIPVLELDDRAQLLIDAVEHVRVLLHDVDGAEHVHAVEHLARGRKQAPSDDFAFEERLRPDFPCVQPDRLVHVPDHGIRIQLLPKHPLRLHGHDEPGRIGAQVLPEVGYVYGVVQYVRLIDRRRLGRHFAADE